MTQFDDRTAVEANGTIFLVDLYETTQEIAFLDEAGTEIVRFPFAVVAGKSEGFWLITDAEVVANIRQWANLDNIGMQLRAQRGM